MVMIIKMDDYGNMSKECARLFRFILVERGKKVKDVYKEFRKKYQKNILVVIILHIVVGVTLVKPLQLAGFLEDSKNFLLSNVLIPAIGNFICYGVLVYLMRHPKIKAKTKNYLLLAHVSCVACVFCITLCSFPASLAFLTLPLFVAAIYEERRYLTFSEVLAFISMLIVVSLAPIFTLLPLDNQLFNYLLVAVVLILMWVLGSLLSDFSRSNVKKINENENYRMDLEGQLLRDTMTGLYNHTAFYAFLEQFTMKHPCEDGLSLAVLDIDNFKKVNDTYGHSKGDEVILYLSEILQEEFGDNHYVCRYGGEEFAVIFRGLKGKEAKKEMDKVLEKFRNHRFDWKEENVTFSCGISEHMGGLMTDKELFSLADKILYRAKGNGKNQCLL